MANRNRCNGTVQNGAELGAPGDEYNKSPCREGRAGLLEDKTHRPLRSREYCQIPFFPSQCLGKNGIWQYSRERNGRRVLSSSFIEIVHKSSSFVDWKCRRRFNLFVDLLNSLKQGTTSNWILMTQTLAPTNSQLNSAWVCWLYCLCWCS